MTPVFTQRNNQVNSCNHTPYNLNYITEYITYLQYIRVRSTYRTFILQELFPPTTLSPAPSFTLRTFIHFRIPKRRTQLAARIHSLGFVSQTSSDKVIFPFRRLWRTRTHF